MAVNATVLQIVQPAATGNVTYSLPANFDPKAIIVFSGTVSATGLRAMVSQNIGFGTYRGGVVQQAWNAITDEDANATASNTYGRTGTDAIAKFGQSTTNTILAAVSLVSMQTGATSQIVLNWSVRTATFTPGLTVLVLGGSDITDAMVGTATNAATATTQSFTVATGFGQPDCLFVAKGGDTSAATTTTFGGQSPYNFGHTTKAAGGRSVYFNSIDNSATQDVRTRFSTSKILYGSVTGTLQIDAAMAAATSWPTDGFAIAYATATAAWPFSYLALRTSANVVVTTGTTTARTTTGTTTIPPTTGTAKAALLFGQRTTTADAEITSSADLAFGTYGMCAADGSQGVRGLLDQDNAATSITDDTYNSAAAVEFYSPTTEAVTSRATGTCASGSCVLNWTTADTSAWLIHYVMIGEAGQTTNVNASQADTALAALDSQSGVSAAAIQAATTQPGQDAQIGVGTDQTAGLASTAIPAQNATVSAVPLPDPGTVLGIGMDRGNHFKLQYVIQSDTTNTYEATQDQIRAGFTNANFRTMTDPSGNPVVDFLCYANGPLTSVDAGGPRVELREVDALGLNAAYDAMVGDHTMRCKVAVIHAPSATPATIYMQLHNGTTGDRISARLQLTSGLVKNLARINGTQAYRFSESYPYGDFYDIEFRVLNGGAVSILFGGVVVATGQLVSTGMASWYFKCGAYCQFNEASAGTGEYAEVQMRDLVVTHNFGTNAMAGVDDFAWPALDAQIGIGTDQTIGLALTGSTVYDAQSGIGTDQTRAPAATAAPAQDAQSGIGTDQTQQPAPTSGPAQPADISTSEAVPAGVAATTQPGNDAQSGVAASPDVAWLGGIDGQDGSNSTQVGALVAFSGLVVNDVQALVAPWVDQAPTTVDGEPAQGSGDAQARPDQADTVHTGSDPQPAVSAGGVEVAAPAIAGQNATSDAASTTQVYPSQADSAVPGRDVDGIGVAPIVGVGSLAASGADPQGAVSAAALQGDVSGPAQDATANATGQTNALPTQADTVHTGSDPQGSVSASAAQAASAVAGQATQSAVSASAGQAAPAIAGADATTTAANTTQAYPAQADGSPVAQDAQGSPLIPAYPSQADTSSPALDASGAVGAAPDVATPALAALDTSAGVAPTAAQADTTTTTGNDAAPSLSPNVTPTAAPVVVDGQPPNVDTSGEVDAMPAALGVVAGDAAPSVAAGTGAGPVGVATPDAGPGVGATPLQQAMIGFDSNPGDNQHAVRVSPTPITPAPTSGPAQDATTDSVGAEYGTPDTIVTPIAAANPSVGVAASAGSAPVAALAADSPAGVGGSPTEAPSAAAANDPAGYVGVAPDPAQPVYTGADPDLYLTGSDDVTAGTATSQIDTYAADLSISGTALPGSAASTSPSADARTTTTSTPDAATLDASGTAPTTTGVTPPPASAATTTAVGQNPAVTALAVAQPVPDVAGFDLAAVAPAAVNVTTAALVAAFDTPAGDALVTRLREAAALAAGWSLVGLDTAVRVGPLAFTAPTAAEVADALIQVPATRGQIGETVRRSGTIIERDRVHDSGPMGQTVRDALIMIAETDRRTPRLEERDRGTT